MVPLFNQSSVLCRPGQLDDNLFGVFPGDTLLELNKDKIRTARNVYPMKMIRFS